MAPEPCCLATCAIDARALQAVAGYASGAIVDGASCALPLGRMRLEERHILPDRVLDPLSSDLQAIKAAGFELRASRLLRHCRAPA